MDIHDKDYFLIYGEWGHISGPYVMSSAYDGYENPIIIHDSNNCPVKYGFDKSDRTRNNYNRLCDKDWAFQITKEYYVEKCSKLS